MSNPRLDNFKLIDDQGMAHVRFKDHPYEPGKVEVWGSMDKRYWTLLEILC